MKRKGASNPINGEGRSDGQRGKQGGVSLSSLARDSRLTRATLRYYEKVGILLPGEVDQDDEGADSSENRTRLEWAISLRNLGYGVDDIKGFIDSDPFDLESVEVHRTSLQSRIQYLQAQDEAMALYRTMLTRRGSTWIEQVETSLVDFRVTIGSKDGEGQVGDAPAYHPISGGAGLFVGDDPVRPSQVLWGRGVLQRHAAVIEGFSDELPHIGGRTCACRPVCMQAMPHSKDVDAWFGELDEMAGYARSNGYEPCGAPFIPRCFTNKEGHYVLLCLPVRKRSRLPHRLAAVLAKERGARPSWRSRGSQTP